MGTTSISSACCVIYFDIRAMTGPRNSEIQSRPPPPSPDEILSDVSRASVDDPVFGRLQDIFHRKCHNG